MLSVVLPLRCESGTEYLLGRLEANLRALCRHDQVECVVVDSASPAPYRDRIRRICDRERCLLVADPAPQHPFAPGAARNIGAQRASGEYILFYDVDLCCQADFVPLVARWAAAQQREQDFLVIPCLFLTERGSEEARWIAGEGVDLEPHLGSLLAGENHLVELVGNSSVAVNRAHFLRLGGYRLEYRGHGCEDFDLLHRLASYAPIGERRRDYYADVRTRFPADYSGFRAYVAYYTLPHLFDRTYNAHLWHPRPLRRRYFWRRRANEDLLQQLMRAHDAGRSLRPALGDLSGGAQAIPADQTVGRPWAEEEQTQLPPLADFIGELLTEHGYDPHQHPGLSRWKAGVASARGTRRARVRKLVTRPRAFFADSRVPGLKLLRHLFRG